MTDQPGLAELLLYGDGVSVSRGIVHDNADDHFNAVRRLAREERLRLHPDRVTRQQRRAAARAADKRKSK